MADNAPGARQLLNFVSERCGEGAPRGRNRVGRQTFDQRPVVFQQAFDRRLDVGRLDRVEAWQAGEVEQGAAGSVEVVLVGVAPAFQLFEVGLGAEQFEPGLIAQIIATGDAINMLLGDAHRIADVGEPVAAL